MRVVGLIPPVLCAVVALLALARVIGRLSRLSDAAAPLPPVGGPLVVHGLACLALAAVQVVQDPLGLPLLAELPLVYVLASWGASAVFFGRLYERRGVHPNRVTTAHPARREHDEMDARSASSGARRRHIS